MWTTLTVLALVVSSQLGVARSHQTASPIQDNSFLLEEAYNQEAGVVQHISTFSRSRTNGDWLYTFTEEWPVRGQQSQLSVTVPFAHVHTDAPHGSGLGDVAINYRYQLARDGTSAVAVAPRVTLLVPAGSARQSRGAGAFGYQVNLPVSVALSEKVVTHVNLGATLTPHSHGQDGARATTSAVNLGQSFVWLAGERVNALVEFAFNSADTVVGPGATERVNSFLVNPGIRWAMNLRNGLQIVPGISVPIGVGPSRGQRAIFFYLSFEHPLSTAR